MAGEDKPANDYLNMIARIEPDIARLGAGAFYASAAISLKRMADAAEEQTKIARATARAKLHMDDEWLKRKGLGDLVENKDGQMPR